MTNESVMQPYISVDINPHTVECLCEKLAALLATNGIAVERSEADYHVSLAYVVGNCEKAILAQIAKKIAEHKLEARVIGVEVLEGQTTGYDYVALSFETDNEFANVSREISEELSTRTFSGGFRSHLTLFRMKKGDAKKELLHSLCQNSRQSLSLNDTKVCAKAVSVFNSSYEKQLTVAI
jgi:hypothetical protein